LNFVVKKQPEVLHRDVKSLNYLITKDMTRLSLCDFGMSKIQAHTTVMSTAGFKGTVRWSAPELFGKVPSYSTKSDIFALGIVFFEIAARKMPYDTLTNENVIFVVKYENERPDIPANTPPRFRQLIECCWRQDPVQRPTAQQVVDFINSQWDDSKFHYFFCLFVFLC